MTNLMHHKRSAPLCVGVFALLAAVLLSMLPTASAHAGTLVNQCHGSVRWQGPLETLDAQHKTRGLLQFWVASDGRRCAMVYDKADGSHAMWVKITKYRHGSITNRDFDQLDSAEDRGTFAYYAGGVQVTGTAYQCYAVNAGLTIGGVFYSGVYVTRSTC